jgi:hypothetical protein
MMLKFRLLFVIAIAASLEGVIANTALASIDFNFTNVTNSTGKQLGGLFDVSVDGSTDSNGVNHTLFTFYNNTTTTGTTGWGTITDIYFADGTLLDMGTITGGNTVNYHEAYKFNFPGDQSFKTTHMFEADPISQGGVVHNGLNPGEWVSIDFTLQNNLTWMDTVNRLNYGGLKIGIHVQEINGITGTSDSYENNSAVPELSPLIIWSVLGGLGLVFAWRKRKVA